MRDVLLYNKKKHAGMFARVMVLVGCPTTTHAHTGGAEGTGAETAQLYPPPSPNFIYQETHEAACIFLRSLFSFISFFPRKHLIFESGAHKTPAKTRRSTKSRPPPPRAHPSCWHAGGATLAPSIIDCGFMQANTHTHSLAGVALFLCCAKSGCKYPGTTNVRIYFKNRLACVGGDQERAGEETAADRGPHIRTGVAGDSCGG